MQPVIYTIIAAFLTLAAIGAFVVTFEIVSLIALGLAAVF